MTVCEQSEEEGGAMTVCKQSEEGGSAMTVYEQSEEGRGAITVCEQSEEEGGAITVCEQSEEGGGVISVHLPCVKCVTSTHPAAAVTAELTVRWTSHRHHHHHPRHPANRTVSEVCLWVRVWACPLNHDKVNAVYF